MSSNKDCCRCSIVGNQKGFQRQIKRNLIILILSILVAVICNVLCLVFYTEQLHNTLMIICMVVDILVGWFAIAFASFAIVPQKRLLKLYGRNKRQVKGKVADISTDTIHIQLIECFQVVVGEETQLMLFLPSVIKDSLQIGEVATFSLVDNIIVEVR